MSTSESDVHLAQDFLDRLASIFTDSSPSLDALLALLEPDAWFRDLLVFSPHLSSRHGTDKIRAYLEPLFTGPLSGGCSEWTDFQLDTSHGFPARAKVGARTGVKLCWGFETPRATCRGYATLSLDDDDGARAMLLSFMVKDWKGFEEVVSEESHVTGSEWMDRRASLKEDTEVDPEVLVVGAGQAGLNTAARLQHMGFRVLVIEKEARSGDLWRKRYPTLTLHATKRYCEFAYSPYPATYPTFLPGPLLADWLDTYPTLLDLTLWTSTTVLPLTASYRTSEGRWSLIVNKAGLGLHLRPKYLVWATGQHGLPHVPSFPGFDSANVLHSSAFRGPEGYAGRQVLIVGAATSALDIAQALYNAGASPTILQRSDTAVVSLDYMRAANARSYPEEVPIEVCDERVASQPVGMSLQNANRKAQLDMDGEMLRGLDSVGFRVDEGPDGTGQNGVLYERFAGVYVDVGCSQLLIERKIKLKHGSVKVICGKAVELDTGEVINADTVILATGFKPITTTIEEAIGERAAALLKPIWGVDEHGEARLGYGDSGHPGLFLALGAFPHGRTYSKYLGLYLRAIEQGYINTDQTA